MQPRIKDRHCLKLLLLLSQGLKLLLRSNSECNSKTRKESVVAVPLENCYVNAPQYYLAYLVDSWFM